MARHATNPGKIKFPNTNIYLNAKRCSGRNTRTPVHQETARKLKSQTSQVEEVCLENVCMHDVHITIPLPPTQHNLKGLALCSRCHLAWASEDTPVFPGKDTHGTLGPEQRGGRGWPTPTPKGRSAHAMTRTQETHKSSDKHIPNRRVSTCWVPFAVWPRRSTLQLWHRRPRGPMLSQEQPRMLFKGRRISSRISFPSCRKIFPLQATTAKTTEKKADLETRIEKLFLDDLAIVHLTTHDRELSAELGALRQQQMEMDTKHVDERPSFIRDHSLVQGTFQGCDVCRERVYSSTFTLRPQKR